ncbi:GGDEF domain-containing protein [Brevundimonas sp. 2R-24]|uniref:diguanylate cyclase n=1 Tax=Peiella sedimenti TaxID=3061083 RepID=A0ABT8SJ76_9CAUL|nr:GGDEF domain-containing protein [Caulobacteraceae bacterium XZ-24]
MSRMIETTLRGPAAYSLARDALARMEAANVWPTPLNFELWLHYMGDPEGALGREIERMIADGEAFTEEVAEALAAQHLPRARVADEIRDAGAQLSRELTSVATAIATAQKSQAAYGKTLASAGAELGAADPDNVRRLVGDLTAATEKVHTENVVLEQRLHASTREVAKLREHLEQVRRDAMTDALTALANRKAFDDELERACANAEEENRPVTLAVFDIDHFKTFNDTWGHQTGDQVLRYVASVIGRHAGKPRIAARFGGEEFALIFPNEPSVVAQSVLETIREEIASRELKRRSTNEDLGAITVSIGFAQKLPGETPEALLDRADEAMYASKRGGRNRVSAAASVGVKAA